jgi:predicted ATP-grasp superfamily ATP-dependent carboligase
LPLSMHTELLHKSEELLRLIGWSGVAMVEYRLDAHSGRAVLMEINGRFWGSYPLAMHSGAGFALLTHAIALGLAPGPMPAARSDLRCRMVLTELKRLVRLSLQRDQVRDRQFRVRLGWEYWRFFSDFVRPRRRYFLWSWRDPLPWLSDAWRMMGKVLGRH